MSTVNIGTEERRSASSWKVRPHAKLTTVDENVLTVTGELHIPMDLPRRMTVVRLSGSRLVVFSAISLDEVEMRQIEEFGRMAFLVVPNDKHRLDAKAWKQRYPSIQVVAPAGAKTKVAKVVPVDTTAPLFADPDVQFVTVPGMREKEAALVVRTVGGTTLVLNDLVGNIRNESGLGGWFLRRMGFAGTEPHIPRPVKLMMVADKVALCGQLRRWAELESLTRILVSHGAVIEEHPQQVLLDLADSLQSVRRHIKAA